MSKNSFSPAVESIIKDIEEVSAYQKRYEWFIVYANSISVLTGELDYVLLSLACKDRECIGDIQDHLYSRNVISYQGIDNEKRSASVDGYDYYNNKVTSLYYFTLSVYCKDVNDIEVFNEVIQRVRHMRKLKNKECEETAIRISEIYINVGLIQEYNLNNK